MAELKTKQTSLSVREFLERSTTGERRKDCQALMKLMKEVTGRTPKMWGASIVGFGSYRYKQRGGQVAEWPVVGFSPRKANLTVYVMPGFEGFDELRGRLGKCKTGVSCIYIDRLADVDTKTLRELVRQSVAYMKDRYETTA